MRKRIVSVLKYVSILLALIIVLVPLYLVLVASFKGSEEFIRSSKLAFPESFLNFENFKVVFDKGKLGIGFMNTAIILVVSLIGNILLGTMAAYALGRFDFKFKPVILGAYTVASIIPTVTTQVATFTVISRLGLMNTRFSVILLYLGTDLIQLNIYLQFIRNIPDTLDEAAIVDGASLFRVFRTVIFPLLKPAITTAAIIKAIAIYNDIYLPYLYMPAQRLAVVSTTLMKFKNGVTADWNVLSAAAVLVMIPMIIIYLLMQKYIFSGITGGAVKE